MLRIRPASETVNVGYMINNQLTVNGRRKCR